MVMPALSAGAPTSAAISTRVSARNLPGCGNGVQWFQERGQWLDGSAEPVPGMIIFFDWDNKGGSGPQDGEADHVGIVQKVENGIIYTVEGNSGNLCRVNRYSVGQYEIMGYGVLRP